MRRTLTVLATVLALALATAAPAMASTVVPGHKGRDGTVTGKYTMVVEFGGVTCTYQVQYRGDFGGDPYLDNGWIINNIRCDDGSAYNYLFVHETDPRYTGNPDLAIWGTWEWRILTVSGYGNIANPMHPHYAFG